MTYNFRDRTGERYGMLTVLERAEDAVYPSGKLVRWKCRCDCGQIKTVIGCNLSKTHSCGCDMYGHNLEDLTGKRFGILTVVQQAPTKIIPSGQHQTMWECLCDCGSTVITRAATLKNGYTRSCGCIKSHGERMVAEALQKAEAEYSREYTFPDCVSETGHRLKFDFAIFDHGQLSCLIEYQGEQHYAPPGKNRYFGELQRTSTDCIKREYCLTHSIPLYEIRYDENIDHRIQDILHDDTVPSADSAKV